MRILVFVCICILPFFSTAQKLEGKILDQENNQGVSGLSVVAMLEDQLEKATITDENGFFTMNLGSGIYSIYVRGLGYVTVEKTINIEVENVDLGIIYLEEHVLKAQEAIISAKSLKIPNATLISKEFFDRIPGAFSDPSRLTIKFPGISPTNDQSNEIIVRGLAPHLSRWAINGASIINPNHLSNAGTITDQASSSGGGVNMISGNSIKSYSFFSNPMSEKFYNVTGGISNTVLTLPEGLRASLGILGTELSYRKNGKVDFGINYRYSTLGILSAIGVPLGDEKINFQDVHIRLADDINSHHFEYNFIYGLNSNKHESLGEETLFFKDALDINFKANQLINSLSHQYKTNKLFINNVWNISQRAANKLIQSDESIIPDLFVSSESNFNHALISFVNSSNYILNSNTRIKFNGQLDYDIFEGENNYKGRSYYISAGLNWNSKPISLNVDPGLSVFNSKTNVELRSNALLRINNGRIKLNYSRQANSIISELNYLQLDPFISNNFSLDYFINLPKLYFQAGVFYNQYSKLPVSEKDQVSYFDRIDLINESLKNSDFVNEGNALQYGFQAQFEYLLLNKLQLISTMSIYDLFVEHDGISINSSYNFNYTYANTVSYKKKFSKSNLIIGLSIQGRGAGFEPEINETLSFENLNTSHNLENAKRKKLAPYFRTDMKIDYVWGKSLKNRLGLDIQNVTNRSNDAYFYFDPLVKEQQLQKQLGLIPILKYSRRIF